MAWCDHLARRRRRHVALDLVFSNNISVMISYTVRCACKISNDDLEDLFNMLSTSTKDNFEIVLSLVVGFVT